MNLQEALDAKHAMLTDLGRYSLQHGYLATTPLSEISMADAMAAGWADRTDYGRECAKKRLAELESELGLK